MKRLSQLLSYVFHPLILPTFGVFILFNSGTYLDFTSFRMKISILAFVFITTFVLPVSLLPVLLFGKLISNVYMMNVKDRLIPLAMTTLAYFVSFYLMYSLAIPPIIKFFSLTTAITTLLATLISIRWKISLHMIGIGGILGLVTSLVFLYDARIITTMIVIILISGGIASARLKLEAHNAIEVISGFALGFVMQYGILSILPLMM